jgi:hypothetical protein
MKKYLWLLCPLGLCGGLSIYFSITLPRLDADGYGYDHAYLSKSWALIAVASTMLLAACLGIGDLFELLERRSRQRAIRRQFGEKL